MKMGYTTDNYRNKNNYNTLTKCTKTNQITLVKWKKFLETQKLQVLIKNK